MRRLARFFGRSAAISAAQRGQVATWSGADAPSRIAAISSCERHEPPGSVARTSHSEAARRSSAFARQAAQRRTWRSTARASARPSVPSTQRLRISGSKQLMPISSPFVERGTRKITSLRGIQNLRQLLTRPEQDHPHLIERDAQTIRDLAVAALFDVEERERAPVVHGELLELLEDFVFARPRLRRRPGRLHLARPDAAGEFPRGRAVGDDAEPRREREV